MAGGGDNGLVADPPRISDEIESWSAQAGPRTLGSLIDAFGARSFAVIFVILLGVPALPLPTGGATHVFEVISMLLSLQLLVGRTDVWLPSRWRATELTSPRRAKLIGGLLSMVRRLERLSRPRLAALFGGRLANAVFGALILVLSIAAFAAPPFSGLDTLPALGGVLVALAVLLRDAAVLICGVLLGGAGIVLELVLGRAAISGISQLFS